MKIAAISFSKLYSFFFFFIYLLSTVHSSFTCNPTCSPCSLITLVYIYKTDFFICKNLMPSKLLLVCYSEYSVNSMCKYKRKIKVHFLFICMFRKYMFCNSIANGALEGAITSIWKDLKDSKTPLIFSMIFAENFTLQSRNIIRPIPLEASNSKYKKSAFSMWFYKLGCDHPNCRIKPL